jgi:hypothetical protein
MKKNVLLTVMLIFSVNLYADISKESKCVSILLNNTFNKSVKYDRSCVAKFITNYINKSNIIIDTKNLDYIKAEEDTIIYKYTYKNVKENKDMKKEIKKTYCNNKLLKQNILDNNINILLKIDFKESVADMLLNNKICGN